MQIQRRTDILSSQLFEVFKNALTGRVKFSSIGAVELLRLGSVRGSNVPLGRLLAVIIFIAGNAIGASVLGLPVVVRSAGFVPACVACVAMCAVMVSAQLLMVKLFIESGANDLPGMFRNRLGARVAAIFNFSYFTLFFCLLVAYWAGSRTVLSIFPSGCVVFSLTILTIACCLVFGFRAASAVNSLLTVCMGLVFLCLCAKTLAWNGIKLADTINFKAALSALPIVILSYCFHGAIPLICQQLNRDMRAVKIAVVFGALCPLIFNISILFVAFRLLTPNDLALGEANGWPVFVALANKFSSNVFHALGNLFSIFAILSSLVGVTITTSGAVRDVCPARWKTLSRTVEFFVVLLLPLAVAMSHPRIFIRILEFAGGILSNLMVGILPIAALIRVKRANWKHAALLVIFAYILCLELSKLIPHG
jgi:tyrosine-specific transport protein